MKKIKDKDQQTKNNEETISDNDEKNVKVVVLQSKPEIEKKDIKHSKLTESESSKLQEQDKLIFYKEQHVQLKKHALELIKKYQTE